MTERSPFRYFKTSPEVIRLAVMLYVRYPLVWHHPCTPSIELAWMEAMRAATASVGCEDEAVGDQ